MLGSELRRLQRGRRRIRRGRRSEDQVEDAQEKQPQKVPIEDIDAKLKALKLKYGPPSSSSSFSEKAVNLNLHNGGNTRKAKWIVSDKLTSFSYVKTLSGWLALTGKA
ncbi:hypothetical protein M0R45_036702 [Rubus argutus]|uniref:DUF7135 domain-containing protein n=1 Tax=Rubus argutus TaxID=59490 RepID=A0AAW1VX04_RUBAR